MKPPPHELYLNIKLKQPLLKNAGYAPDYTC